MHAGPADRDTEQRCRVGDGHADLDDAGTGDGHRAGRAGLVTVTVTGPGIVEVSVTVTDSTPLLGIPVSQTRMHTAQLLVGVTSGEGLS